MAQVIKPHLGDPHEFFEVIMLADQHGNVVDPSSPVGMAGDAFGRLRTSSQFTLFDSQMRYQDNGKFSTSTSGSATTSHNTNDSCFSMNVTGASGDKVVRESTKVFPYQPGKSLLILTTFTMNAAASNLRQRVGYFTTQNGIFLEQDGSTINIVKRSYTGGSISESRIAQANWNGADTLDGNGLSGITLDLSKSQIFFTDIEWLGVGSVRCGFIVDGKYYIVHTFHHANSITGTYMTTANLPVRYEIENTGSSSAATMKQICSTVISEGGYQGMSYMRVAGRGISTISLTDAGTYYHVASIRLKSTRLDGIVLPAQLDLLAESNINYRWMLLLNPTFATTPTWSDYTAESHVQYSITDSVVTGGTVVGSNYITNAQGASTVGGLDNFNLQLGRTLAGVSDVLTLVVTSASNSKTASGQIGWFEL